MSATSSSASLQSAQYILPGGDSMVQMSSRSLLRAVSRQNLYLALGFCTLAQLLEMTWPWIWEIGLQLRPEHRIRRGVSKIVAGFLGCVALGQLSAVWCFSGSFGRRGMIGGNMNHYQHHGPVVLPHLAHDI
ncbi:unnamed protein product [Amoebophrya sp. A25]|nr:unnamed protein product [Amoebophrya sp. A25]|eukprot:GSA25T00020629001.1